MVTGPASADQRATSSQGDRDFWIGVMRRLADPVLTNLANGTLKTRMPVEQAQAAGADRRSVTHLEAIGRLLAGIAPWLELPADDTPEGRIRAEYADLARRAIARAVDPASADFLNFTRDRQPLVDAAFLAQGLLRAPRALRDGLDSPVKRHLIAALESTRSIVPNYNNWYLNGSPGPYFPCQTMNGQAPLNPLTVATEPLRYKSEGSTSAIVEKAA